MLIYIIDIISFSQPNNYKKPSKEARMQQSIANNEFVASRPSHLITARNQQKPFPSALTANTFPEEKA